MKKVISLLLLCAMLAPSIVACSESGVNDDETKNTPTETNGSVADGSVVDVDASADTVEKIDDGLPEVKYNGADYNIFSRTNTTHYQFLVEELNAEPLNDAIYYRNSMIEERFDVNLTEQVYSTEGDPTTLVTAGDQTYSLMNVRCTQANNMAQRNYCIDIDTLEHIKLDMPYWDADLTHSIAFGDRNYVAIGSANLVVIDYLNVLLFNKELLKNNGLEDPYTLVREGKWTFDKFGEMAGQVTNDANGDGVYDASDTWGLLGSSKYTHCSFIQAGGGLYVQKDENNYPVVKISKDEHFVDVFTKIFAICNDNNAWYLTNDESNEGTTYHNMFRNNQGLFLGTIFYWIDTMRDMESEFGILPFPKWDENQAEYISRVSMFDTSVVPTSTPDVERSSIILEAITCESFNSVLPIYKDIALKGKYARDEESADMVDLIFDTALLDLGDSYFCGDIRDGFITKMFYNDTRDIVSEARRREKVLNKTIEVINKNYESHN